MRTVEIGKLQEGMVLGKHVFRQEGSVIPLATKGTVLTDKVIQQLKTRDIWSVYIAGKYDLDRLDIPTPPPIIDPKLQNEAITSLENVFSIVQLPEGEIHQASAQIVKALDTVVEQLVSSITKDRKALVNITDLKSYDEYTYHHSLSVAVLALAIGQNIGFSKSELNSLGKCAMLHDIGKIAIPIEIINKPARLSPKEYETIKTHSMEGVKYLAKNQIGDETMWRAVMGHHEKYDGSGYPNGLKGTAIPLASRIISIADVYDALTSNRSYRSPMQPAEAIEFIMGNGGVAFDYSVLKIFLEKLELYPVGSFVELSNGKAAVVIDNQYPMRPVVQLIDDSEILDLYWDKSCLSLTITKALNEQFAPLEMAK